MTTPVVSDGLSHRFTAMIALITVVSGIISGCQSDPTAEQRRAQAQAEMVKASPLGNVEYYTYMLANELFDGVTPDRQARYAVVGFVPADTMVYNGADQGPLMMLGHQLEQGLITEATKRGFTTQEFKITNDILIGDDNERVFSRDIEQLSDAERIDFYVTGTLVYQQSGAMVNARIVNVRNKQVVAAATRFFPGDLFWENEQVTSRNGRLYRTEGKR